MPKKNLQEKSLYIILPFSSDSYYKYRKQITIDSWAPEVFKSQVFTREVYESQVFESLRARSGSYEQYLVDVLKQKEKEDPKQYAPKSEALLSGTSFTQHEGQDHSLDIDSLIKNTPNCLKQINDFCYFYKISNFDFRCLFDEFFIYRGNKKLYLTASWYHGYETFSEEEWESINDPKGSTFKERNDVNNLLVTPIYNPECDTNGNEVGKYPISWDGGIQLGSQSGPRDFMHGIPPAIDVEFKLTNSSKLDEFFANWPEIPYIPELVWTEETKEIYSQYREAYKCEKAFYLFGLGLTNSKLKCEVVFPPVLARVKLISSVSYLYS